MSRKIFVNFLLLTVAVLLAAAGLFLWASYREMTAECINSLKQQARLVTAFGKTGDAAGYASWPARGSGDRLTVLDADGKVLFDNYASADELENHWQRKEVQQALRGGEGFAVRRSATLDKEVIYYAVRLPDGNILRMARTVDSVYARLLGVAHYLALIVLLLLVGALWAAKSITGRVVRPLTAADWETGTECVYPELQPLLDRLLQQREYLQKEMRRYKNKKQELKAVTNNMDEGLLFLDNNGEVVSINKSALRFFGCEKQELLGKSVLQLELGRELEQLMEKINNAGKGTLTINRGSWYYQLNGSRVGGKGIVLLIMDVTEKTAAEKLRREFSANVSHELKTPLQSVLGYSEIMLSGLVKEDDRQRFLQKIYDEAKNLLRLIDDIIKLSRLDEQQMDTLEQVDLRAVVAASIKRLEEKAARCRVSVRAEYLTEKPFVFGLPSLLEEIVLNLTDNAIKYNHAGGSVVISLKETENKVVLSVADTGLGIATEEKDRIFERFYRIDKSRHKAVDGTGLGLSIVKHGVLFHKGTIKVNSKVGEGTEIIIKFPKKLTM